MLTGYPYLSNAQFLEQCGPAFAAVSNTILTTACLWASKRADTFLAKRYALPLKSYDLDLSMEVFALVQWKVSTQIGFRPSSGQNEAIKEQRDEALQFLQAVSIGDQEISCVDANGGAFDKEGSLAESDVQSNFRDVTGATNTDGTIIDGTTVWGDEFTDNDFDGDD